MTRFILVTFAVLVLIGTVLSMSGVLRVQNSKNETGVTIDKKELKEKTQDAVKKTEEAGGKILDKTGEALHKAAENVRGPSHDQHAPPASPQLNDKNSPPPDASKHSSEQPGT